MSDRYTAVVVPHSASPVSAVPKQFESETLQGLWNSVWPTMKLIGRGWLFLYQNGVRLQVSHPQQVYSVQTGESRVVLNEPDPPVYPADGSFCVLVTTEDD